MLLPAIVEYLDLCAHGNLAASTQMGLPPGDELSHYQALEAEVQDALAGVSGAHARLSELDQGAPSPQVRTNRGLHSLCLTERGGRMCAHLCVCD